MRTSPKMCPSEANVRGRPEDTPGRAGAIVPQVAQRVHACGQMLRMYGGSREPKTSNRERDTLDFWHRRWFQRLSAKVASDQTSTELHRVHGDVSVACAHKIIIPTNNILHAQVISSENFCTKENESVHGDQVITLVIKIWRSNNDFYSEISTN